MAKYVWLGEEGYHLEVILGLERLIEKTRQQDVGRGAYHSRRSRG